MKIGIFGDIHFSPKGLDRIVDTGEWIIQEFKRRGVERVVCLGDSLVTREEVDVMAQSKAINFFKNMANHFFVDVLLGNHDMNLKHASHISSLEGLTLHGGISLHRDITVLKSFDNVSTLMIPYHEDQSIILKFVEQMGERPDIIVFGHLSLNGAVQNTRYNTKFTGAIGPDVFKGFKRTYTGHFHVHQRMDHRVTYVGSPLQFNFGDAGDERGIMVYDTVADIDEFIINPHHDAFKVLTIQDIGNAKPEELKDRFITVLYDDLVTESQKEEVAKKLTDIGVLDVRSESVVEKAIREHVVEVGAVQSASAEGLVEPFVKTVLTGDSQLKPEVVVQFGKAIIRQVNEQENAVNSSGKTFNAQIDSITLCNFMGIQGEITLNLSEMNPGIWYLEGSNGAGKSTVLESIVWCYFGEQIRSDVKVDDVINDVVGKNTRVVIKHTNGYVIERFRKHTTLGSSGFIVYKDGVRLDEFEKAAGASAQSMLNELIGIDYSTMIKSYILGQNITANFITAGEKPRREMIEGMLGLEKFDLYLEKVRTMKKDLIAQFTTQEEIQKIRNAASLEYAQKITEMSVNLNNAVKQHEENISRISENMRNDEQTLKTWPGKHEIELEEMNGKLIPIKAEVAKIQAKVNSSATVEADLNAKNVEFNSLKQKKASVEGEEIRFNNEIGVLAGEKNQLALKMATSQGQIDGIKKVDELGIRSVHAQVKEMASKIAEVNVELNNISSDGWHKNDKIKNLETELKRLQSLAITAGSSCPTCTQTVSAHHLSGSIEALQKSIESEKNMLVKINEQHQQKTVLKNDLTLSYNSLAASVMDEASFLSLATQLGFLEKELTSIQEQAAAIPSRAKLKHDDHLKSLAAIMGVAVESRQHADRLLDIEMLRVQQEIAVINAANDPAILANARKDLQEAESRLFEVEAALATLKASFVAGMESLRQRVTSSGDELARAVANNPAESIKSAIKSLQDGQQQAFIDIEAAKRMAFAINQKQAYVVFWEKAFQAKGSMRSFLLEDSVGRLNLILQDYTKQHFGGKMTITFNPDLTIQERYGRRSGGQRKWSDLCVLMSLFELAHQRCRYLSSFIALDEVFDALDGEGRRAVQEMLSLMTIRARHVFVITHADIPGGNRTGTILASMTDVGTTLVVKPQ